MTYWSKEESKKLENKNSDMIKLENLIQYYTSGGVIFTKDVVTLTISHPQ